MKYFEILNENNYGRKKTGNHYIVVPKKLRTSPEKIKGNYARRTGVIIKKFGECYKFWFIRTQKEMCRSLDISPDLDNFKIILLEDQVNNKRVFIPFRIYFKGFEVDPKKIEKFESLYSKDEQHFIYGAIYYMCENCALYSYTEWTYNDNLLERVYSDMQRDIMDYRESKVPKEFDLGNLHNSKPSSKFVYEQRQEFEDGTYIRCTIYTNRALNYNNVNSMLNDLII